MMKKIVSVILVLLMCLTVVPLIISEDTSAETSGTIKPKMEITVNCSGTSLVYPYGGSQWNDYKYYTENPEQIIRDFLDGKRSDYGTPIDMSSLSHDVSYWAVSFNGWVSSGDNWEWKSLKYSSQNSYLFLPKGTYKIECSSNNMDETSSRFTPVGSYIESDRIKNGNGTVEIIANSPMTVYLETYSTSSSGVTVQEQLAWSMNYKITPSIPEMKEVDCETPVTVTIDKRWVRCESTELIPAGSYVMENDTCVAFISGSDEERTFYNDVVAQRKMDTTGYDNKFTTDGTSKVCRYELTDTRWPSNSFSYRDDGMGYNYHWTSCTVTEYNAEPYKFYAGQSFSLAVDYDQDIYSWAVLKSDVCTVYMVPKVLYQMDVSNSTEYEIYLVTKDSSTSGTMDVDVMMHTEGVSSPDNSGIAFAVVAIGFCAIAFFMLFFFGRRPKWGDMTGLPDSLEVPVVQNEVSADEIQIDEEITEGEPQGLSEE